MRILALSDVLFTFGTVQVRFIDGLIAAGGLVLALLLVMVVLLRRLNRARVAESAEAAQRQHALDERLAGIGLANAELAGKLASMSEAMSSRQSHLARFVSERLDAVGTRVGQGIDQSARSTNDTLSKLQERLAVINSAQARLTGLTQEVVGLKDILANKQSRGAFGQGRMEAIVRDGLPSGAYDFQPTLSNGTRPDCLIRLPGDERAMVIDAKFPLEALTAFKDAKTDDQRRQAVQRVKGDIGKHVKDIAERYFLPGETQDLAILFVPSESVYADLNEHFDELVQKAHRARILIVSPTLLMMAVQVMQAIVRDARMQEQAHVIQAEVRKIVDDIGRLRERVEKLNQYFHQAQDSVAQIITSTDKIVRRGQRIDGLDFAPGEVEAPPLPVTLRRAAE